MDDSATVEVTEHGGDAAIDVAAEDEASCLAATARAFGQLVGDGATGAIPARRYVRVEGDEPVDRLLALLDKLIEFVDVKGLVAFDAELAVRSGRAEGLVHLMALDDVEATGSPPKAVTWHGARCERDHDGRWRAHAVVDL